MKMVLAAIVKSSQEPMTKERSAPLTPVQPESNYKQMAPANTVDHTLELKVRVRHVAQIAAMPDKSCLKTARAVTVQHTQEQAKRGGSVYLKHVNLWRSYWQMVHVKHAAVSQEVKEMAGSVEQILVGYDQGLSLTVPVNSALHTLGLLRMDEPAAPMSAVRHKCCKRTEHARTVTCIQDNKVTVDAAVRILALTEKGC